MYLICSHGTVHGGPVWNKERSYLSYHRHHTRLFQSEPAYLFNKSGAIGLLLFCDTPKLQKKNNKPQAIFAKSYSHISVSFSLLALHGTHSSPPKRPGQPPDVNPKLLLPAEAGSHGTISLLRRGHEPPCGPALVVAPPPSRGSLRVTTWCCTRGGSTSPSNRAPMSPHGPTPVVAPHPSRSRLSCCYVAHTHGGSASQVRWDPMSPHGSTSVVAPPPRQGGLPCHHMVPRPWWLRVPAKMRSRDATWSCAHGGSVL
jgi:hypothetical protein